MVTYQSMPRFVSILLKLRCPDAHMFDHLNDFFQTVLRSTAELLRTSDVWELVECAARVLTDGAAYQIYERPEMRSGAGHRGRGAATLRSSSREDGDIGRGSDSSGDGSASDFSYDGEGGADSMGDEILAPPDVMLDDSSPSYRRNIQVFHDFGGFHACIERIGREPRVHLNGAKLLLRPLAKASTAHCQFPYNWSNACHHVHSPTGEGHALPAGSTILRPTRARCAHASRERIDG